MATGDELQNKLATDGTARHTSSFRSLIDGFVSVIVAVLWIRTVPYIAVAGAAVIVLVCGWARTAVMTSVITQCRSECQRRV